MATSKTIKTIALTATSQRHHVSVKVKSIIGWLRAGHEVRVTISGKSDRRQSMEEVFSAIENDTKYSARIYQKLLKPDSIRFNLKPTNSAINIEIDQNRSSREDPEHVINELTQGKDLLSDDFEKELDASIKNEASKNKK